MKTLLAICIGMVTALGGGYARAATAATTATPATTIPQPPAKQGCYQYTKDGWKEVPCATDAYIKAHYPHPQLQFALVSDAKSSGPDKGKTLPLVYGQVKLAFTSVGSIDDNKWGRDAFSIQNNTNLFIGGNGDTDGVQFAVQSRPNQPDGVCVWNVNVTTQDYSQTFCVSAPKVRAGGFSAGDAPKVQGMVLAGKLLAVVAYLPWAQGGASFPWAMVSKDVYGLSGRWSEVSGSVLGFGGGSKLSFSSALVSTSVEGSTCAGDLGQAGEPQSPCAGQTEFKPSAYAGDWGDTEERNNLIPLIGAPGTHFPGVSWLNTDLARIRYCSTTTGTAPDGESLGSDCTAQTAGASDVVAAGGTGGLSGGDANGIDDYPRQPTKINKSAPAQ